MANLVPLHIDKDSGKIVGKFTGGSIPTGGSFLFGYTHIQSFDALVWPINHNFSHDHIIAQIYDNDNQLIFPDKIDVQDADNIEIQFTAPQSGYAHIVFLKAPQP